MRKWTEAPPPAAGVPWDHEGTACYVGFFTCFNGGRFFEAHDALEPFWLRVRSGSEGPFFKGLIQLAGAFVHVQKGRIRPALALFGRARFHLDPFRPAYRRLRVAAALELIREWEGYVAQEASDGRDLLAGRPRPRLQLGSEGSQA